ncbi:MAG: shikimate dehydrogenase [Oceanicoccus sp.]|jgi:shikimate dehydrogenase
MSKAYWVVTHPLTYRVTEPIINAAFQKLDYDGEYDSFDIPTEGLEDVVNKVRSGELSGLSVFTPHKGPSVDLCDVVSDEIRAIGAVNYMQMEEGKLVAYNLDWEGALRAIKSALPDLSGKHILVLGAGGAGRAVAYYGLKEGAKVTIWNRSPEKAKKFAEEAGMDWVEHVDSLADSPHIIVNATRVSSQDRQRSLLPYQLWDQVELAMESVCQSTSLFLEEAKAMNVDHIIRGEDWAAHQMNSLLRHITGQEISSEQMHELVHEVLV